MNRPPYLSILFSITRHILALTLILALVLAAFPPQVAQAAPPGGATTTFWVSDPGDAPDAIPGNGSCQTAGGTLRGRNDCTLRAAIQEANALAGAQVIAFEICGEDFAANGDGSYTISPTSPLPAMTSGLTYINGYTQGYGQIPARYDDPAVGSLGITCTTTRSAAPNTNNFSQALNTVLSIIVDGGACVSPVPTNGIGGTRM